MTRLFATVHTPGLYGLTGTPLSEQTYECKSILRILDDLTRNCLLLVDDGGIIMSEIRRQLESWPPHLASSVTDLFELLGDSAANDLVPHRIVKLPLNDLEPEPTHDFDGCSKAFGIAKEYKPDALISRSGCTTCIRFGKRGIATLVGAGEYHESRFAKHRRAREGTEAGNRTWTLDDFIDEFYRPFIQYAKHVKIVDRWVGRSVASDLKDKPWRNAELDAGYKRTIKRLYDVFLEECAQRRGAHFQIVCGVHIRDDALQRKVSRYLHDWADSETDKSKVPIEMYVKSEPSGRKIPHSRCIITDLMAVLIDPGMNLGADPILRDFVVKPLDDSSWIDDALARLQDIPPF